MMWGATSPKGDEMPQMQSRDRSRKNVFVGPRRTSVSLEIQVWDALDDVCFREEVTLDEICSDINRRRLSSSMSSSLRMFLLIYYRYMAEVLQRQRRTRPSSLAQRRQTLFPSAYDVALDRFAAEQRAHLDKA